MSMAGLSSTDSASSRSDHEQTEWPGLRKESEPKPNEIIPSGTVTSRIHQLRVLAHPNHDLSRAPLLNWDTESVSVG